MPSAFLDFSLSFPHVGSGPQAIAFDSHTNSIWMGNDDGTVTQISDATYATSTYSVGSLPDGVAFDPHTNSLWVANGGDNIVTKFVPSQ